MKRRTFITSTLAMGAFAPAALAADTVSFSPGVIQKALDEGKTVFVDYYTGWCSTCARQERVINELRKSNADYDAHILFVKVDFDKYGSHPVSTKRNIPRRSTLIALKGSDELGRIVAGTSKSAIKELMDAALAVASS
ncbi:hypothetical protein GCM10007939_16440 [Amylibacter marinus]|uniref:Thioredoxin domain-containing protein n=1 Tax=Amylibacter marinus TaxID=1475483 RepID=A0ABQ5VVW1_9RHOB|nr:thioredoxin family protein [Amylibacter marinus]GLQ35361.1 hypothetical protein GCM10007939_16440 [Amylibacter marinus]